MKKFMLSTALSISFVLCSINASFAESIAVRGDLVFIADGGLVAKNLSTGQVNQCLANPLFSPHGTDVTALLGTATDVVIKKGNAIVTIHPVTEAGAIVDVVTVDVTDCLVEERVIEVSECISTANISDGVLIIPCVDINGVVKTVHMNRRGKSSNWEVSFFNDNPALANFHDDEDENDDR